MVEDRDRCLKGMNHYLSKPIIESDLENTIEMAE
jgi:CheY-like chemotaxis protein